MKQLLLITISLFYSSQLYSQEVDLIEFVKNTQKIKKTKSNMKMLWWIPTCYWEIASKGNQNMTEETLNEITNSIEDYTIVAGFDGKIGAFGFDYDDSIMIKMIDNQGNQFLPLKEDEISYKAINLLRVLKPTLANVIGQMGQNMEFYVFSNKNENGEEIINPTEAGKVSFILNDEDFQFKTPLESLVQKKACPIDDELMSGNWKFCPWHGKKLNLPK